MKDRIQYIWEEHDVHDADFERLDFDFETGEISVSLGLYDDLEKKDVDFKMIFGGVFKFTSEYPPEMEFRPDGCYGWHWREPEPGKFEADFRFTIDQWDAWEVTIGFTSLEIEGGLSEEARADRAAYLDE